MPDRAVPPFGLVIRKLIVVVRLSAMLAAPNDLSMVGGTGDPTETVAVLLVVPGPLSVEVIAPVVLFWTPEAVPVTVTLRVQFAPAASVPPEKARLLPPLMTSVPPHGLVVPLGAVKPAGKVSLKLMPVKAPPPFGLLIRKLIVVVPLSAMLAAPNDLTIVGGETTVTVAVLLVVP